MGILNVTPDSFSGDGVYKRPTEVLERARQMVERGADVLDVGGESTRPGARPVSADEELARVLPAIRLLAHSLDVPVSVDTSKSAVAKQALAEGASIVNDVSGLSDSSMLSVVAATSAALVLVHNGAIRDMACPERTVVPHLRALIAQAEHAGVAARRLIVDPGLGLGKDWRQNFALMRRLDFLRVLERPVLVGPSRKGMIGRVLGTAVDDRLQGSLALASLCVARGADMVRVHDVQEVTRAVRMMDAIIHAEVGVGTIQSPGAAPRSSTHPA